MATGEYATGGVLKAFGFYAEKRQLDITTLHITYYTSQNALYITILISDYVNFT
jgi:hypothetical protein